MKRLIVLMILIAGVMLFAGNENLRYQPIADCDGFWSPLLNPAALSYGNSDGFAFVADDEDGELQEDHYSLFFNSEGLSYVFERDGRSGIDRDRHALATGVDFLSKNLYVGAAWKWQNKEFDEGSILWSTMWRPANLLSLAASAEFLNDDDSSYRIGMSVRPLGSRTDLARKLTVSADLFYDDFKDVDTDWQKPVLAVSAEPVTGLLLGGSYDLENEMIGLNASVDMSYMTLGGIFGFNDEDRYDKGNYYAHFRDFNKYSITEAFAPEKYYIWKLNGEIKEEKTGFKIGPISFFDKKIHTTREILDKIKKMRENDKIKGIVFKNANFSCSFAIRQEIIDALNDFRAAGKEVIYYGDYMGGSQYCFAAAVSDQIYLHKNGSIDLRGISVTTPYFKNLLDTLGVDIVNFQSHEYKTAFNMLSEDHMTDAERETYEYLLDGLYTEMKQMVTSGRADRLKGDIDSIIDNGPYMEGGDAYDAGLVDFLIYEDEFLTKLEEEKDAKFTKELVDNTVKRDWYCSPKDNLAVIYAVGNIIKGKGRQGQIIGSQTTAKAIRKAREDDSVKGILLRIDSGGGSAFASDVINREIELCRETGKPVVATMSGAAASGGYYIASNADMIIAQPATITGSIGVIGVFPYFERLYDKIFINWSTVKKGANSDFGATHRKPTETEIKKIEDVIAHGYDDFIGIVAKGRSMAKEDVHEVAKGRVWTGKQALDRGLVDKLGGYDMAVEELKVLAGIKGDVNLIDYSGYDNKFEVAFSPDFSLMQTKTTTQLPKEMKTLLEWWNDYKLYENEKALMLMPIKISE